MFRPCPFLPEIDSVWRASKLREIRESENLAEQYLATLQYSQSLLHEGKPAQAILQINKALSFQLNLIGDIATQWNFGYPALCWILGTFHGREGDHFLGNPVRHFQHLATRLNGSNAQLRSLRAWACFHLAEKWCPELPRDEVQIRKENFEINSWEEILRSLSDLSERQLIRGEGLVLRGTGTISSLGQLALTKIN